MSLPSNIKSRVYSLILLPSAFCLLTSAFLLPPSFGDEKANIIEDDLFEGLTPAEAKPEPAKSNSSDELLLGGEDIDLGRPTDPFARIAGKMQRSQQALTAGKSAAPTQELQKEILGDLDALLKKMQKQCAGGQCKNPGSNSSAGNSSKAGQRPSQKPANDSTARVGKPGDTNADSGDASDTIKEVWGHLPPKVREAMQNASLEEFLPKYDKLIEDFYRRLADQPVRGR
jgi:hypothetical protein